MVNIKILSKETFQGRINVYQQEVPNLFELTKIRNLGAHEGSQLEAARVNLKLGEPRDPGSDIQRFLFSDRP